MLWKNTSNSTQDKQHRGLAGNHPLFDSASDDPRLKQARELIRQVTDELLAGECRITEAIRPLRPGVQPYIQGWAVIADTLVARLQSIIWKVQGIQDSVLTPEDGLAEAKAVIRSALHELRPDAELHPRKRPGREEFAPVGNFVELFRYHYLAVHLADQLVALAAQGDQPHGDHGVLSA